MSIRFLKSGLQTSVQDLGRTGLMRYGISRGGAADSVAMTLANLLLGNPPENPALEVTLTGPSVEFQCDISIAIVGADFELQLNNHDVESNRVLQIKCGDTLSFGGLRSGARAYIAFSGQMELPLVLDGFSTYLLGEFGGLEGRAIRAGDTIHFRRIRRVRPLCLEEKFRLKYTGHPRLRVVAGAEEPYFSDEAQRAFYRQAFRVSAQSNRMGIRLSGDALGVKEMPQLVSSGLCPGTIQVPPSGQPIVSFVEGQTIGGYPRIAHVISADQHMLGQLKPNDRASFSKVSLRQAREILAGKVRLMDQLQAALAAQ
ncbi:biotin-dependent carboxyltransferase family protein [Microbulbifer magnicolonia]|uniref:5-oxoprolinase subunit C family protein n=1 Tax=Microbulbifer magnicolonia TaxID=3109744 RepID=UPI002B40F438|nr:biotin-dependent carboxyltransferase family protein [Microbulbifer sp. GG15]